MKLTNKLWQIAFCLFLSLFMAQAQTEQPYIKMKTDATFGSSFSFLVKPTTKSVIKIDWGNGKVEEKTIDPNGFPYERKVTTSVQGSEVTIYGALQELECTDLKISGFSSSGQSQLKMLDLSRNLLTKDGLNLDGLTSVENLSLNENQIASLDVRTLTNLESFSANKNPSLGTVIFSEGSTKLKQISMSDGDISHFYPISLPSLTSLNLNNNSLLELEVAKNYPSLSTLYVEGNALSSIDVTECLQLTKLNVNKNQLRNLDVKPCKELLNLFCAENKISSLNVIKNTKLTNIDCSKNQISMLDVSTLGNLTDLNCSENPIATLDFKTNTYLKNLRCASTQTSVLNFRNNNRLRFVDLRNNTNMTSCSINFMFSSMWPCDGNTYSANLLIAGSNGEKADKSTITSEEYKWILDITPDGSAQCNDVAITIKQTTGGTLKLLQEASSGDKDTEIINKALAGAPIRIQATAKEGYKLKGIKVNGQLITQPVFIVSEAATVEPVWGTDARIILGTKAGQAVSFALGSSVASQVSIDWGDGNFVSYEVGADNKRFDNTAAGTQIIISGDITYADFASYPGMGLWENEFTSINLGKNEHLSFLSLYMNPIKTLDVSGCPALTTIDCAYTDISALDLKENTKLTELICYGNNLTSLDLQQNKALVKLEARRNKLTSINLSANALLTTVDLQGNSLSTIDLNAQTQLQTLRLDGNQIASINLENNTEIATLSLNGNKLSQLNLEQQTNLLILYCGNNNLKTLDLSSNTRLAYLNCVGNAFSACALNDIYYTLPEYPNIEGLQLADNFTLRVTDAETSTPNDAIHAESVLATIKGWKVNQEGDGSGCPESYVVIQPYEYGKIEISADGKSITTGSKVKKGTELLLRLTPDANFILKELRINGKTYQGDRYKVESATFIQPIFVKDNAVDVINQNNDFYTLSGNALSISSEIQSFAIFSLDGASVDCSGNQIILPRGTYVLQIKSAQGVSNHKILVP